MVLSRPLFYLPTKIIERYNIKVIPMNVTMGDLIYPDGSFDVQKVFDFYNETGMLPKTSGSTPEGIVAFIEGLSQRTRMVFIPKHFST